MHQRLSDLRKFIRSYSFVLAAIYASLFCISIIAVLAYVYHSSHQSRLDEVDQEIANIIGFFDQTLVVAEYRPEIAVRFIQRAVEEKVAAQSPGDPFIYLLVSVNGRKLAGNLPSLPKLPPDSVDEEFHREGRFEFNLPASTLHDESRAPLRVEARAGNLFGTHILLVGRNMNDIDHLGKFPEISLWSIVVTIALAIAGAILFSKVLSGRLQTINQTCHSVMMGEHGQRVKTNDSGDAFDELARNVNEMLDRIQKHIEDVRSVTDHAVHNVKTPLNHMRIRLEEKANLLDSAADGNNSDLKSLYYQIIEEVDSISETFNLSLQIANMRTDSGIRSIREQFEIFDPMSLVEDIAETFIPYAEDAKLVRINVIQPNNRASIEVFAHRNYTRQALSNLVDNAIKASPTHGTVNLYGLQAGTGFRFAVSDEGPGIPDEHHESVRVVGYRLEQPDNCADGYGLGLSFVDAIADIHNVELKFEKVQNSDGLEEFQVSLGEFEIFDIFNS